MDIVERLRAFVAGDMILAEEAIAEAADEIERLRTLVAFAEERQGEKTLLLKEIERLRDALKTSRELRAYDRIEVEKLRALTGRKGD